MFTETQEFFPNLENVAKTQAMGKNFFKTVLWSPHGRITMSANNTVTFI